MGKARCRIVQWDYIEDSIFTKSGKPRAISANFHEIQSVLRRQRRFNEAKSIYKKKYIHETNSTKGLADPGRWLFISGLLSTAWLRTASQASISVASYQILEFAVEASMEEKYNYVLRLTI